MNLKEVVKVFLSIAREVEDQKAKVKGEALKLLGVEGFLYQMPNARDEDVDKMKEEVLRSLGVSELSGLRAGGKVIRMGTKLVLYMSADVPVDRLPKFPGVRLMDVTHYPLADVEEIRQMGPDQVVIVRIEEGPCELSKREFQAEVPGDKVEANELISKSMTGSRDPEDLATALAVLAGVKRFSIIEGSWEDDGKCVQVMENLLREALRS